MNYLSNLNSSSFKDATQIFLGISLHFLSKRIINYLPIFEDLQVRLEIGFPSNFWNTLENHRHKPERLVI
jgi:hypothetical protein